MATLRSRERLGRWPRYLRPFCAKTFNLKIVIFRSNGFDSAQHDCVDQIRFISSTYVIRERENFGFIMSVTDVA